MSFKNRQFCKHSENGRTNAERTNCEADEKSSYESIHGFAQALDEDAEEIQYS